MYSSGSFSLTYDETILNLDSFAVGNGLFGIVNTSEAGLIRFNGISIDGVDGSVVLGTGQFTALADGHSGLTLSIVDLPADTSGNSLPNVNVMNGNVTVGDGVATATQTPTIISTGEVTQTPSSTGTATASATSTPISTLPSVADKFIFLPIISID